MNGKNGVPAFEPRSSFPQLDALAAGPHSIGAGLQIVLERWLAPIYGVGNIGECACKMERPQ